MTTQNKRSTLFLATMASALLLACQPGSQATAAPEDACQQYAAKLCTELGEQTPACKAAQDTTNLMPAAACWAGMNDMTVTKEKIAALGAKCTELIEKLCADLGPETQTCGMVREKTKQFPPDRCVQMLGQYKQVLAELQRMEAQNKPLSPEVAAELAAGDVASFGAKDAKVTVVEFSDFQCPYCTRAANAADEIKKKYGDKVRIVFRHFPLSFHKEAHLAAQASLAANAQGKFWEYHDKLFANQKAMFEADLKKYAKELKLNMKKFNAALANKTYAAAVDADMKLGEKVAVSGTPTMFVNGQRVSNPTDINAISALIDKAL